MRNVLVCVSAAALLVAGCGSPSQSGGAKGETVQVDPAQVSPQDLQAAVKDERVKRFYAARNWAA
jgi:hypothetical protein